MNSNTDVSVKTSKSSFFGFTGWFLAAMLFFYAWVLRVSPSVMIEQLMREFSVSGAVLGNLSAVYFYFYASLQLPVGLAHDRWGPRRVLSVTALVAGAGAVVFAYAPTLEIAYLGRAMIGAGSAFALVGSMILASRWFAPKHFALLSASALSLGLLGGISGQAPVAYMVQMEGWRNAMLFIASGAVVMSVLIWFFTRDFPEGTSKTTQAANKNNDSILVAVWKVARQKQIILIALFTCMIGSSSLAFGALWGVPYAMLVYEIPRTEAAFAISSILFGWVVGGPFWGWFSDKTQRRKMPIVLGSFFALASITAVIYLPDLSLGMFRFILFINGFCAATMALGFALVREQNIPGGTGAALGLVNMFAVGGGAIFQPLVGLLLDNFWDGTLADGVRVYTIDNFDQAFLVLPLLHLVALVVGLCIRETYCKPINA